MGYGDYGNWNSWLGIGALGLAAGKKAYDRYKTPSWPKKGGRTDWNSPNIPNFYKKPPTSRTGPGRNKSFLQTIPRYKMRRKGGRVYTRKRRRPKRKQSLFKKVRRLTRAVRRNTTMTRTPGQLWVKDTSSFFSSIVNTRGLNGIIRNSRGDLVAMQASCVTPYNSAALNIADPDINTRFNIKPGSAKAMVRNTTNECAYLGVYDFICTKHTNQTVIAHIQDIYSDTAHSTSGLSVANNTYATSPWSLPGRKLNCWKKVRGRFLKFQAGETKLLSLAMGRPKLIDLTKYDDGVIVNLDSFTNYIKGVTMETLFVAYGVPGHEVDADGNATLGDENAGLVANKATNWEYTMHYSNMVHPIGGGVKYLNTHTEGRDITANLIGGVISGVNAEVYRTGDV